MTSQAELVGQFVLSRTGSTAPEGWPVRTLGPWQLAHHPDLAVAEIRASDAAPIGWLLGWAVGHDPSPVRGSIRVEVRPDAEDVAARFEEALYGLGGRFAAVLITARTSRFYLDPCGSLAAVYCLEEPVLASTINLIPPAEKPEADERNELARALGLPEANTWYPFGLTGRRSVERLIPNHYLDLEAWRQVRHWPDGEIGEGDDLPAAVARISLALETAVAAAVASGPAYMSLTAGRDSRMLLACAREHLDRLVFFTYELPGGRREYDYQVARKMARRLGLNHLVLPFEPASEEEVRQWLYRSGGAVGGLAARLARTLGRLDRARTQLSGQAGDVVRAAYWGRDDTETTRLDGEGLVERMRWSLPIPAVPEVLERARAWLEQVPLKNTLRILDLLYIEQRLGCWAGPREYGYVNSPRIVYPFCRRAVLEEMLRLPARCKRLKLLEAALIAKQWPELLRYPFNAPAGLRGLIHTLRDGLGRRWNRRNRARRKRTRRADVQEKARQ